MLLLLYRIVRTINRINFLGGRLLFRLLFHI